MFRSKLGWTLVAAMCGVHAIARAGAQPPPSEPVRIGGAIKPPAQVKFAPAIYPEIARSAKVQGVVIIDITIDPTGKVVATRVIKSIALLDHAALETVREWRFVPTIVGGVAVPVILTVMVPFSLTEAPTVAPWSIAGGLSTSALHALVTTKNVPFTADLSIVLEGSDDDTFTGRLARDRMGRTRIDLAAVRPQSDRPGRRATWILDPGRSVISALGGDGRDPVEDSLVRPSPFADRDAGPDCEHLVHGATAEQHVTSLGTRTHNGLTLNGCRTTYPFDRIHDVVVERWYSTDLHAYVVVRTTLGMKRYTFELTNLSYVEPAPSLFELPRARRVR